MMGTRIGIGVKLWQSLQGKRGSMEKIAYSATMGIEWGNDGRHPADWLALPTSLLLVSLRCLFHSSPSACSLGTEQC